MGLSSSKAFGGELQDRSEVKAETELLLEVSGTEKNQIEVRSLDSSRIVSKISLK